LSLADPSEKISWLINHRRCELALQELAQALAMDPDNPRLHSLQSICYQRLGQKQASLHAAQATVQLAPDWCNAYYFLADALYELNRFPEAEAAIQQAIALDPEDADYYSRHAKILVDWGKRIPEALAVSEAGLALDPEHRGCNNLKALALLRLQRWQEAEAMANQILQLYPDYAFSFALQGWVLLHRPAIARAISAFREALRLDPQFEWAQQGLDKALPYQFWLYRWLALYSEVLVAKGDRPLGDLTGLRRIGSGVIASAVVGKTAAQWAGGGGHWQAAIGGGFNLGLGLLAGWWISSYLAHLLAQGIGILYLRYLKRKFRTI
jgi:tetratricopeptide (TPR) repeat protein